MKKHTLLLASALMMMMATGSFAQYRYQVDAQVPESGNYLNPVKLVFQLKTPKKNRKSRKNAPILIEGKGLKFKAGDNVWKKGKIETQFVRGEAVVYAKTSKSYDRPGKYTVVISDAKAAASSKPALFAAKSSKIKMKPISKTASVSSTAKTNKLKRKRLSHKAKIERDGTLQDAEVKIQLEKL